MKAAPRIDVELKPPRMAMTLVALAHAGTAALLLWLPLPTDVGEGGAAIVVLCGCLVLLRRGGRHAAVALRVGLDRRIAVRARDGTVCEGTIHPDSYVGARLATIVWRPDGSRWPRTLLVIAGTLDGEEFRRLRVALRYGAEPASSEVDAG
jgi:hypothetical protein